MKTEFVICSAIKRNKPKECVKHYHNNDIYDIEIGYRHCDIYARFKGEVSTKIGDQGFYTSRGRFVDRQEARPLAPVHSSKVKADTFVDACYEMILKLHEVKIL